MYAYIYSFDAEFSGVEAASVPYHTHTSHPFSYKFQTSAVAGVSVVLCTLSEPVSRDSMEQIDQLLRSPDTDWILQFDAILARDRTPGS